MQYITELQKFIASHDNWRELLENEPYHLKIKEKDNLIIFKYNQIDSDFYNPIVREARGIILDKRDWSVVCRGFDKFGNYGEGYTSKVNFAKARIQEKIDGSIIKLYYYDGQWNIATNGMIDAFECELHDVALFDDDTPQTFGDLFMEAIRENCYLELARAFAGNTTELNTNKTYIFEVISPYNKVVISYPQTDIYHIGTRDNISGEESVEDIGVPHPQEYTFNSIEDVVTNAKNLPYDVEGYVVVDSNWNRCKVKGAMYLSLHHLKGESVPTEKRFLSLVLLNEGEEFLSYFPEYESGYNKLKLLFENFVKRVESDLDYIFSMKYSDRKSFAQEASKSTCPPFVFAVYDHKWSMGDFRDYCGEMQIDRLLLYIKEG